MLRLAKAAVRRLVPLLGVVLVVAACGTKGPLVPAKKAPDAPTPAPPPAATTVPDIPSATLPSSSHTPP